MTGTWLKKFDAFLKQPTPGFSCYACGDQTKTPAHSAPVRHTAAPPEENLNIIDSLGVPHQKDLQRFFSRYGRVHLFANIVDPPKHSRESELGLHEGLVIFAPSEWKKATEETKADWVEHFEDDPDDWMIYDRDSFIAIGHVLGAWNTIHLITSGPHAGRILFWPWTMPPEDDSEILANRFSDFINTIIKKPVELLNDYFTCLTRYSDGQTDQQWIPLTYHANIHAAK